MQQTALVHPRMLEEMVKAGFFPWLADIQAPTQVAGTAGTVVDTWATVPGLEALPAARGQAAGTEVRGTEMITEVAQTVIKLAGRFDDITPAHRVSLNTGEIFDITSVDPDALGITTQLTCIARTPVADLGE